MSFDYWASIASSIDESFFPGSPAYRRTALARRYIESRLGRRSNRLLDCGCGTAASLVLLADLFDSLYACDNSSGMLEVAMTRRKQLNNLQLFHWDITQSFPVDDWQLVDVITLFSVLPYIKEWANFFHELRIILKPGGLFIASFPNQLFDLYSLNSLTADFILTELVDPSLETDAYSSVASLLKQQLHKPAAFPKNSAYLNSERCFKRANPLTIGKELARFGVQVEHIFYMNNHPIPPGCVDDDDASVGVLRRQRELDLDYEKWTQMFTNSTFLVVGQFQQTR